MSEIDNVAYVVSLPGENSFYSRQSFHALGHDLVCIVEKM